MIGLKELQQKYNKGNNYFRTILCRPEFNQFRVDQNDRKFYVFNDCENFHKMFKFYLKNKKRYYPKD